jgi:phosphomannomutase
MVSMSVTGTLLAMGADVIDLGLTTTPTLEVAVTEYKADGGIMITASHNPLNWNALKLLGRNGEFLNNADAAEVIRIAEEEEQVFCGIHEIGNYSRDDKAIDMHIAKILALPLVDADAIRAAGYRVTVDAVNSTGGIAVPRLLKALGVKQIFELYCTPDGRFAHNPEPLPENIHELAQTVIKNKSHVGFAVDPDVDRLAMVDENGDMFGEEYTLVAVADYVLSNKPGNTVSNLSSTSALRDVTLRYGGKHFASAIGEVNVVEMMKQHKAVIGGEGNGGVIYPGLHYGRDALVGIALFLSFMARSGQTSAQLRNKYPDYFISKNKIEVDSETGTAEILQKIHKKYKKHPVNTVDGVRIEIGNEWVHLRRSNTEPLIRIYAESDSMIKAEHLAKKLVADIREILRNREEE